MKTEKPKTEYVVKTSSARVPMSCRGSYAHIAVMEVLEGIEPKMISERARGVVRIVETWWALNVGKTEKCAYRRALAEAEELADKLNGEN